MIDRQTTIGDLIFLNEFLHGTVLDDAIALLKAQEPVEAEREGGGNTWRYVCGECHGEIGDRDRFCRHCGQAVKWE